MLPGQGGTFVVFAATVTSTGILPVEGLAVIFGVYRFMSIGTATCNMIGNSVATVVIAKWSRTLRRPFVKRAMFHFPPVFSWLLHPVV